MLHLLKEDTLQPYHIIFLRFVIALKWIFFNEILMTREGNPTVDKTHFPAHAPKVQISCYKTHKIVQIILKAT